MKFAYEINKDDLLIDGVTPEGDIYQKPNRDLIREMAKQEQRFKEGIAKNGGNTHQVDLDISDAFVGILMSLPDSSSRELVASMRLEEVMAITNHTLEQQNNEFNKKMQQQEEEIKESITNQALLQWGGVIAIVLIAMVVIANL